jgi:hypothetical protein
VNHINISNPCLYSHTVRWQCDKGADFDFSVAFCDLFGYKFQIFQFKIRVGEPMDAMKLLFCVFLLLISGCFAQPPIRTSESDIHQAQTLKYEQEIRKAALTGDWLVTRGYHATDTLVANVTGIPLSHVGVYDSEGDQVIEAEGKGIHATPLSEFINKSYRLLLIRPKWSTPETRYKAIGLARALIGKSYDFLGTIGFNFPSRYYCSELAIEIYKEWHGQSEHLPKVITPGELYLWGTILYDSLPRN